MAGVLVMSAFCSCADKTDSKMSYRVIRSDFDDQVVIEGTVYPIRSTQMQCEMGGTVLFLTEDGDMVQEGDTVCILENKQLIEWKDMLEENMEVLYANYEMGVANLKTELARLEMEARNNELQEALTQLDSIQMEYYSPMQRRIAELNLQKTKIQQEKLERNIEVTRFVNGAELKRMDMELRQHEERAAMYREQMKGLVLTAPTSGMFLRADGADNMGKLEIGDEVNDGNLIAEIPDPTEVEVRFSVGEQVYKRLRRGQPVRYSFSAMPGQYADGRIRFRAAKGHQLRWDSQVMVYDVTASVETYDSIPTCGFSANCMITLKHLPDTICVPTVAVFDKDSLKVVYVEESKGYREQEVRVGAFSSHEMVIEAGLTGGETISLVAPKESRILRRERLSSANPLPSEGNREPSVVGDNPSDGQEA